MVMPDLFPPSRKRRSGKFKKTTGFLTRNPNMNNDKTKNGSFCHSTENLRRNQWAGQV